MEAKVYCVESVQEFFKFLALSSASRAAIDLDLRAIRKIKMNGRNKKKRKPLLKRPKIATPKKKPISKARIIFSDFIFFAQQEVLHRNMFCSLPHSS